MKHRRPEGHRFTLAEVESMTQVEYEANEAEVFDQLDRIGEEAAQRFVERRESAIRARTATELPGGDAA